MVSPVLGTAATLGLTVGIGYVFGPVGAVAGALLGNFLFGRRWRERRRPAARRSDRRRVDLWQRHPVAFATQKNRGTIIWGVADRGAEGEADQFRCC